MSAMAEGKWRTFPSLIQYFGEVTDKGECLNTETPPLPWKGKPCKLDKKTLEDVFPTVTGKERTGESSQKWEEKLYNTDSILYLRSWLAQPEVVFIPVSREPTANTTAQKAF